MNIGMGMTSKYRGNNIKISRNKNTATQKCRKTKMETNLDLYSEVFRRLSINTSIFREHIVAKYTMTFLSPTFDIIVLRYFCVSVFLL